MRISRPDGISQENRSHPFFIMLRKFADEQYEVASYATNLYIRYLASALVVCAVAVIASATAFINVIPLVIFMALALYLPDIKRYRDFKELLHSTCFNDVERMIFSNDYQLSHLNMEETINTMVKCTRVTGSIERIIEELRNSIRSEIIFMAGLLFAILYKVVFYGV